MAARQQVGDRPASCASGPASAATSSAGAGGVGGGIGMRNVVGQEAARRRGGQSSCSGRRRRSRPGPTDRADAASAARCACRASVQARVRPPRGRRPRCPGDPRASPPGRECLVVEELLAVGASARAARTPGDDRGRRRSETPAVRDPVGAPQVEPGRLAAEPVEGGPNRPDDQVRLVPADRLRTLTGDVDAKPGARVTSAPRASSYTRGRARTSRSPGRGSRSSAGTRTRTARPVAERRSLVTGSPSAQIRAPRRSASGSGGTTTLARSPAASSAVSTSFRPWPVTVMTTVWPRSSAPAAPRAAAPRHRPRTPARRTRRPCRRDWAWAARISVVGYGVDPATGLVACGQRLRPPGRVADPDRGRDGLGLGDRRTARRSAPHPPPGSPTCRGRRVARPASAYSRIARPVSGDVAGVADRQGVDVGRVAEHVDDLVRRGLLTGDAVAVGVGGVDQDDGIAARTARGRASGSRRSCPAPAPAGHRARSPGRACPARSGPPARAPTGCSPARTA